MRKLGSMIFLMAVLIASDAMAQVTGGGTAGTVPVFTGTSTVGNSPISVSGSNVGIGTTNPDKSLTVTGSTDVQGTVGYFADEHKLALDSRSGTISDPTADGGFAIWRMSSQPSGTMWYGPYITLPAGHYIVQYRVKVTSNASSNAIITLDATNGGGLNSYGSIAVHPSDFRASGDWEMFSLPIAVANNDTEIEFRGVNFNSGVTDFYVDYVNVIAGDLRGYASPQLTVLPKGDVGIGTTSPAHTLEVNGAAQIDSALYVNGGVIFPNGGGTQTTAWTGVLCGGDYAEDMRASGGKDKYGPGDVLVLAPGNNSDIQRSVEPYSTMVAGIYATKPGVVGRREAVVNSANNVPMAMVGVVPTKVTADNGPIHKGDLLVTSSQEGYAMKGTDRSRMLGAVIGKAMGSLDSGTGMIEVLVTLQ